MSTTIAGRITNAREMLPHGPSGGASRRMRPACAILLMAIAMAVGGVRADGAAPVPPTGEPGGRPAIPAIDPATLPPIVRLGFRAERTRLAAEAVGTVVIVSDAASYVRALEGWTPTRRYPVLIDDGSTQSREDIARFVRAYQPRSVVRWSLPEGAGPVPGVLGGVGNPSFNAIDPTALSRTVARAWGVALAEGPEAKAPDIASATREAWRAGGHTPPGIVVVNPTDPAWTGGLALAAGRGQPIIARDLPQHANSAISPADADAIAGWIEGEAAGSGWSWRGMGDDLDAITIAANLPTKLDAKGKGQPGETYASGDRWGRLGAGLEASERWAWSGQLLGTASTSAYQAMGALFLWPRAAWVFDAYEDGPGWSAFDGSAVAKELESSQLRMTVSDAPRQGERDWRLLASRAIDADVVLVNTMGEADVFRLRPGDGYAGDLPMLQRPAAIHFVHSWSTQFVSDRNLLAGRWIERGAMAYCGSVHEPFLQAFVPTPLLARRLAAGVPWGVACRVDAGPMWKIAVFGDPLLTWGPPAPRVDAALPLEGARSLAEEIPLHVQGERFADAIQTLALIGQDDKAAALSRALLMEKPEAFTPDVAASAVLPMFRAGMAREVVAAMGKLGIGRATDPIRRDALWLAAYPIVDQLDEGDVRTLFAHVRPEQAGRDAALASKAAERLLGPERARAMVASARERLPDDAARARFDQMLARSR